MVDKQKLRELKNKMKIEELEKELTSIKETNNELVKCIHNLYTVMDIKMTSEVETLLNK